MDTCGIEGPWGPHHTHHHFPSFQCEEEVRRKEEGEEDKGKERYVPKPDKTHAVQQLHALLPTRPDVAFLRTDPEFLVRFLRARKFRVGDAFLLLCRYFEYRQRHRDLFRGLNVGGGGEGEGGGGGGGEGATTGIQAALLDGLPGVLAERDPCGRPVIVLLASNWDHSRYDVRVVFQAVLLTLERLVEDESVQSNGVVAIIDWSNFPTRLTTSLSPKLLRLMLDGLQDAFPLRLGSIHLVNQPWYIEAALGLARPFLKEKLRSRIHAHGNNLATLHAQVPPRLLPAELGGEGGEYHALTWASTMLKGSKCLHQQQPKNEESNHKECSNSEKSTKPSVPLKLITNTSELKECPKVVSPTNNNYPSITTSDTDLTLSSPNTPLVDKPENNNSTLASSITAMIFRKLDTDKSNGNISDEEESLKAH